jgi:colicin import membrane protein
MAEMQDSSVLFSLKQLMSLEQQRIREEEEEARRRAEAESAARREAERRAREEHEMRLRAEEARLRAEEERRRESAARLEAICLAEIEKARFDAARQERLALMEQANEHERKLAALKQDAQKKRLKRLLVFGGAFTAVVLSAAFGIYFGHIKPEADRIHAEELSERAVRDAELARLKSEYEQAVARAEKTAQDLAQTKSEAERIRAQQTADAAKRAALDAGKRLASGRGTGTHSPPPCKCADPNDPLCGCLDK